MKHALIAVPLALLAGCTTAVYHPEKSQAEMQADVNLCTDAANRKYWMDPIAALYNAYDCLEVKGYSRTDFKLQVEQPGKPGAPKTRQPVQPCRVPCS